MEPELPERREEVEQPVEPRAVEGGYLTAYDHLRQEDRTFSLHRITGVAELDDDAATLCDLHVLFFSYVQGVAIHLEREQHALAASGLSEEQWIDHQAPAMAAMVSGHPTFARMMTELSTNGYDLVLDDLFESGLRALLDGLALRYGR